MAQFTGGDRHRYVVARYDESLEAAHRLLKDAADEWAKGHPEEPPTWDVLQQILELFSQSQFLTIPYGAGREDE